MASNKENKLVEKNADNLGIDTISKSDAIETENKSKIVSSDELTQHKEDNGFATLGLINQY